MSKLLRVKNLEIPRVFQRGKRRTSKPKNIIIHDSSCLSFQYPDLQVSQPPVNIGTLKSDNINKNGLKDINYHYVVELLDNDIEIMVARPLTYRCEHTNIISTYRDAIHIIFLMDFHIEMPNMRVYNVIAYRALSPLINSFRMGSPENVIKFHNECVKASDKEKCPGTYLVKSLLTNQVRKYYKVAM